MNKDLPEPIKEIFTNLDPLIWKGVWLEILEKLLSHDEMVLIWQNLYEAARSAYSDGTNSTKTDHEINMPFDQFTVEQLAGDLLPAATLSQRLATGFNRNHRTNDEGGSLDAEFEVEYVVDRVDTTSTVWLGLTTGCARCHDHKYDPVSQKEYYRLFAFFNNVPEKGI